MNMQERNRNPYQNIDWKKQIRVTGCTHLHCSTRQEDRLREVALADVQRRVGVHLFHI